MKTKSKGYQLGELLEMPDKKKRGLPKGRTNNPKGRPKMNDSERKSKNLNIRIPSDVEDILADVKESGSRVTEWVCNAIRIKAKKLVSPGRLQG